MNRIVHLLEGGYRMCSRAMMMADIAELLPEYQHVWMTASPVEKADPHLDSYMVSKGVEVVYSSRLVRPIPKPFRRILYMEHGGVLMCGPGLEDEFIDVHNVPRQDTFIKCRNTVRSNVKFHIGLLHGEHHGCYELQLKIAEQQPENSTLFITTFEGHENPDEIWKRKFAQEEVFGCPYRAGAIHKYLEWMDVLAMSSISVSDRLKLEAEAAGVPVIMGDRVEDILKTVNRVRTDREAYNQMRRQCLRNAAGNDMAYEIVKIKTHLGKVSTWKDTTPSRSEQELLATLIPQEASI